MRNYIKDKALHGALDKIEAALCYRIKAEQISESDAEYTFYQMNNRDGRWVFECVLNTQIPQEGICHELSHMKMILEHWPLIGVDRNQPDYHPALDTLWFMLKTLCEHVEVHRLMAEEGYSDEKHDSEEVLTMLAGGVAARFAGASDPSGFVPYFVVARLANALLSQAHPDLKKRLEATAARICPREYEESRDILALFGNPPSITQDNYLDKILGMCRILHLPPRHLLIRQGERLYRFPG